MPCYQRRTIRQELKNANMQHLEKAMEQAGGRIVAKREGVIEAAFGALRVRFNNGQLSTRVSDYRATAAEAKIQDIKKKYTEVVFSHTAKRMGWSVNRNRFGKLEATRKRYARV